MKKEINIEMLEKAISVIDNEALRLRDEIKKTKKRSDKVQQRLIYTLKDKIVDKLYRQKLLYTDGYYNQKVDNREQKLFVNKVVGGNGIEIYTSNSYKGKEDCFNELGDIIRIEHKKLNNNLNLNQAMQMIENYIKNKENKNNKTKKSSYKNLKNKIKETKLVELSRLRVIRDVHINGNLNPILTEQKKKELKVMLANNKNKYPKEEAILVHKSKDPKDKRRIVYNIEDGYRRFLLAEELGLDKVYVNIIDE